MTMIVKPTVGLTEAEGRAVLRARFTDAGFEIVEDYALDLGEGYGAARGERLVVTLDGYDPARRVGYEYLTREANDRGEFTDPAIGLLYRMMMRGEARLLLIDGAGKPDAPMIEYLCRNFFKSLVEAEATAAGRPAARVAPASVQSAQAADEAARQPAGGGAPAPVSAGGDAVSGDAATCVDTQPPSQATPTPARPSGDAKPADR